MDEQPRVIDLIPRRLSVMGLLLLAGLGAVAGLVALHAWMLERAPVHGRFAAFDLGGERSLATWFSLLTLLAASLAAVLVYTVRRYRADDYQGHYRIWLWAAMCWLLLSADKAASLHEGFQQMMVQVTGTRLFADGAVWWIAPYCFLLGAIGSRLLVDMRRCRLSCAALLASAGCYGLAVAVRAGWVLGNGDPRAVMLKAGAEMVGDVFLLLAMGLYGRHVILDAEGLLPRRPARRGRQPDTSDDEADEPAAASGDAWTQIDPPHGTPQPILRRSASAGSPAALPTLPAAATATAPAAASASAAPASDSALNHKLTKAERKALRQRLEQQRVNRQLQQRSGWTK